MNPKLAKALISLSDWMLGYHGVEITEALQGAALITGFLIAMTGIFFWRCC